MRVWSHAGFGFPLPTGHRYPLAKYALLRDHALAAGHEVDVPGPIGWEALLAVHDAAWVHRVRTGALDRREARVLGLPGRRSSSSAPVAGRSARSTPRAMRSRGGAWAWCSAAAPTTLAGRARAATACSTTWRW